MNHLLRALVAVSFALSAFNASAQNYVISTLGDSITKGWPYYTDFNQGVTYGGFQPTLRSVLLSNGISSTVLNYGIPGDYTPGMVNRTGLALSARPNFLLFMGGINDLAIGFSFPSIYTNTSIVANIANSVGTVPFMSTLLPNYGGYVPQQTIAAYNSILPQFAVTYNAQFCDHYYAGFSPAWFADNIHPNTTGYSVMGSRWANCVKAYLDSIVPKIPPIAANDTSLNNVPGKSVDVYVVGNDIDQDGSVVVSSIDLSVTVAGEQKSMYVPGQGNWTAFSNGIIRFTPDSGFSGKTAAAAYTVKDNDGLVSNTALISVAIRSALSPAVFLLLE